VGVQPLNDQQQGHFTEAS